MIFAIVILISILISILSEKLFSINSFLGIIAGILSVLPLAIIAGTRNFTVGTDIGVYGLNYFYRYSSYNDLSSIFSAELTTEKGYAILNWLSSRISSNPHVYFFILNLIGAVLIYFALINFREYFYLPLGMFIYEVLIWVTSLNLLRQSIAIALIYFSYKYMFNRKIVRSILLILLASQFHSSAIVFLLFLGGMLFVNKIELTKKHMLILFICMTTIFALGGEILQYLEGHSVINERYSTYTSIGGYSVQGAIFQIILSFIPLVLVFPIIKVKWRELDIFERKVVFLLIITCFANSFQVINYQIFGRFSFYFYFFYIIGIPMLIRKIRKTDSRFLYSFMAVAFYIVYFIYFYYFQGYGGILPYSSDILDWYFSL